MMMTTDISSYHLFNGSRGLNNNNNNGESSIVSTTSSISPSSSSLTSLSSSTSIGINSNTNDQQLWFNDKKGANDNNMTSSIPEQRLPSIRSILQDIPFNSDHNNNHSQQQQYIFHHHHQEYIPTSQPISNNTNTNTRSANTTTSSSPTMSLSSVPISNTINNNNKNVHIDNNMKLPLLFPSVSIPSIENSLSATTSTLSSTTNSRPAIMQIPSPPSDKTNSPESMVASTISFSAHHTVNNNNDNNNSNNSPVTAIHKITKTKKKYECTTCFKNFTTSGHLARHTRIHTGERNHICPFEGCGARFSRQDNCMQHFRTHSSKGSRKRNNKSMGK